jgi:transcriptional regulator with XRE-family HTH domain
MPASKYTKYDTVRVDGPLLERLRSAHQPPLTQQDLAAHAGISRGYISLLERGLRQTVSRSVAGQLAAALGIDLDVLILPGETADAGTMPNTARESIDLARLSDALGRLPIERRRACIEAFLTLISAGLPE